MDNRCLTCQNHDCAYYRYSVAPLQELPSNGEALRKRLSLSLDKGDFRLVEVASMFYIQVPLPQGKWYTKILMFLFGVT